MKSFSNQTTFNFDESMDQVSVFLLFITFKNASLEYRYMQLPIVACLDHLMFLFEDNHNIWTFCLTSEGGEKLHFTFHVSALFHNPVFEPMPRDLSPIAN